MTALTILDLNDEQLLASIRALTTVDENKLSLQAKQQKDIALAAMQAEAERRRLPWRLH